MKKLVIILAILVSKISFGQNKIALIVAIGNYDPKTGWSTISSANDVPLIKAALIKQGFEEKDIVVIKDEQCTKAKIIQAIKTHLIDKAQKNGVAVFHYSGHGQQVLDDNNDEADNFDEAIVSYDAQMRYQPGKYTGQNHIRDEELGGYMDQLREKLGKDGNLLLILDACHSGTATRGLAKSRGTEILMAPDDKKPVATKKSEVNSVSTKVDKDKLATMVCFFGASSHELNFETEDEKGNGVGSLSYAFSKVFGNADKNSTYQGIFDKIKVEMASIAPRQTPQSEGDLNYKILGGAISGKPEYYNVEKYINSKKVMINAGEINGIFKDTKVGFYPIETRDISNTKPLFTGTITSANITNAEVLLDADMSKEQALGTWVYITDKNFGNMEIKVMLNINDPKVKAAIQKEFVDYKFIKIVNAGADLIIDEGNKESRGNNIKVSANDDYPILEEAVNTNAIAQTAKNVTQKIKSYAQAKYIRGLEVSSADLDVVFEFIPIEVVEEAGNTKEVSRGDINSKKDESGVLTFKEGESFKIKITNNGTKPVYYTIIDIQPDNVINLVVPNASTGRLAVDYRINPGESKELADDDIIQFFPPYGNEVFKLIATETPLDLNTVITKRSSTEKSNPFETLMGESYKSNGTRGPKMPNVPVGGTNIYTLVFKITK